MTEEMDVKKKLSFKKHERLKSRKVIESLFLQNQHLRIYPFKLVWITSSEISNPPLKMGVSVSKRLFKSAVDRNFIKRRLRESIRLNKAIIEELATEKNIQLSFMLIYLGKEVVSFSEFESKIKHLFFRLGEKLNNL